MMYEHLGCSPENKSGRMTEKNEGMLGTITEPKYKEQ